MYSRLNDIILDASFSIPTATFLLTKLARGGVHEITPNMHTGWFYTDTWLDS